MTLWDMSSPAVLDDRDGAATAAFDLGAPLPRRRLQIEASAGTGKTYTIAALVVRAVAGDAAGAIGLDQVLVVTFTRAAAAELRERIRRKLAAALDYVVDGLLPADDPWMTAIAAADDIEARRRAEERLRRALARFDETTITTIHGFCQQVLAQLGGLDGGATIETGVDELIAEVVRDLVIAELADDPLALSPTERGWPRDSRKGAGQAPFPPSRVERYLADAVRMLLGSPGATPVPTTDHPGLAGRWAQLVAAAVAEVGCRQRRARQLSFDRLIADVGTLVRADRDAATWLADRYALVLVDEFQDTDRSQWEIFSAAFGDSSLITVGDPKQAIYRFRGADVNAYLAASAGAEIARLDTNFRSDADLLEALAVLWNGAQFGTERIRFMPVAAAPGAERGGTDPVLAARRGGAAVVVNLVEHGELEPMDTKGTCYAGPLQAFVAADLARRVQQLLVRGWRPSDIAVLVNSQRQAAEIAATLGAWGIASTRARTGDVFATESADQWRILLAALVNPGRAAVARAAGLGWFVGARPVDLVDAADIGDPADLGDPGGWSLATVQRWFAELAHACRRDGLVALVEALRDGGAFERVVAARDGDRRLADIEHIAEVLVDDVGDGPVEPSELFRALDARIVAVGGAGEETTMRRLADDSPAVQISTIHAAKGLEYPVVLVPFAYAERPGTGRPYVFNATDDRRGTGSPDIGGHDAVAHDGSGGRRVDVASWVNWTDDGSYADQKGTNARKARATAELDGDGLRLLYVAMTRAKHHLQLWWAPAGRWSSSPLARLLLDREGAGALTPYVPDPPALKDRTVGDVARQLDTLAAASQGAIEVRRVGVGPLEPAPEQVSTSGDGAPADGDVIDERPVDGRATDERPAAEQLRLAPWRRATALLDPARARWSFTAITRAGEQLGESFAVSGHPHGGTVAAEPPIGGGRDEPEPDDDMVGSALDADDAGAGGPLPLLAGGVAGAAFGVMAHAVLEHVDLTAPDVFESLTREVAEQARGAGVDVDVGVVAGGLAAAAATPLGALFDHRSLDSFAPRERLAELTFDLELAAGAAVTVQQLADVLDGTLPADDPVRSYLEVLRHGLGPVALDGWLTGSIDGVFRVGTGTPSERYVVVDYKTNRLHDPAAVRRADVLAAYHPRRLGVAMAHHHYPLQALLYSVALHRYLRWRLGPAYDPDRHLGGIGYLFVRGMVGVDTPADDDGVTGVFAWRPPEATIAAIDALFRRSGR